MKVSLIIPTYNRSQLLAELLTSVVDQAYHNAEVLVVDNMSTDNTHSVVESFARKYNNGQLEIRYLRCEEQGATYARNYGLRHATGEAVMFVDSDDLLSRPGLRQLVYALEGTDHDMAYSQVLVTRMGESTDIGFLMGGEYDHANPDYAGYHWHTMGALYRRELLAKVGDWNTGLTGSQDWEYQARVKMHAQSPVYVDTVVGYFRQHEGDRVGATEFRYDYTASVEKACNSIAQHSLECGVYTPNLSLKLAKKLYVHALEFSSNGHETAKHKILRSILGLSRLHLLVRAICTLCFLSPKTTDRLMHRYFLSRRAEPKPIRYSASGNWQEHLPMQIS